MKTKILISITSYDKSHSKYLKQIIENYQTEFSNYDLYFVLSLNYPYSNPPTNSTQLPKLYNNWNFTWNAKKYLKDNYDKYSYIIESDDDILVTKENFQYFLDTELKHNKDNLLTGFLVYEQSPDGKKHLITMPSSLPRKKEMLSVNNNIYIVPFNQHSACFICDAKKYKTALKNNMPVSPPTTIVPYTSAEFSRTELYFQFKKVIPVEAIVNEKALVKHLSAKYWNIPTMRYSSWAKPSDF